MKKILNVAGLLLALAIGTMIYFYMAEPVDLTSAEPVQAPPAISAKHAILIDGKSGEVFFEKAAEARAYPASTTKIMTALVILELCQQYNIDIDTKITVPKEAIGIEGSSIYLKERETRTIEDLLYGMMLQSGNDAATALAICVGGNEAHFVKLMNDKAGDLRCRKTNFANPSGLYDENHYTTAKDLACIAKKAMENKVFCQIVATETRSTYTNKNKTVFQYEGGNGIKIGFTEKSGRTLVASATRSGSSLICVLLNAPNWFNDAYALMDYGFAIKEVE